LHSAANEILGVFFLFPVVNFLSAHVSIWRTFEESAEILCGFALEHNLQIWIHFPWANLISK